jgi:hypothetical protein
MFSPCSKKPASAAAVTNEQSVTSLPYSLIIIHSSSIQQQSLQTLSKSQGQPQDLDSN